MVSFAQNGEDVVLQRAFPASYRGVYIDVGAADPVNHSVTKHFYDHGWRGINVDPSPGWFALLRAARPDEVNLQAGVGRADGVLTLYEGPPGHPGGATFSERQAKAYEAELGRPLDTVEVPITTLARICADHVGDRTIDFLKVDAEGFEREVLEGADWERWRPRVVVVEATEPNRPVPNHQDWEDVLVTARYRFVLFDGLNRFYVREEEPALVAPLSAPANVFDDYVPYEHVRAVQAAEARAAVADGLGPRALAMARVVHRLHEGLRRWRSSS
jgi:FkbM family methyltransferase